VPIERVDDPGRHPVASRYNAPVDTEVLDSLLQRAGREVDEGLLPACQIAVAYRGQLLATRSYGTSPTSRFAIYSCTKAITAGAMWLLLGDGLLERSTRVADVLPPFAEHGKDAVTVEHLLTHTAGFPSARMPDDDWVDPRRRMERLASWKLEWEPGSRFVYHGSSAHWVLAQLAESVTGTDFRKFVRDALLGPLRLDSLCLGPAPADQDDVLDVVGVGDAMTPDELDELGGSIGLDVSAIGTSEADLLERALATRGTGRGHGRDPLRPGRPDDRRCGEPHAGTAAGRQCRYGNDAGLRLHQLTSHVRAHGRRRAGLVGRSDHRPVIRLPDERARPKPGAHGGPRLVAVLPGGCGGRGRRLRP
jgi:CubicO group peptidase (beta-lactamase class C family)